MNCKKGDLAMIVGGLQGTQIGIVVTCLELLPSGSWQVKSRWGPLWRVDRELKYRSDLGIDSLKPVVPDMILMPINPLRDETEDRVEEIKA